MHRKFLLSLRRKPGLASIWRVTLSLATSFLLASACALWATDTELPGSAAAPVSRRVQLPLDEAFSGAMAALGQRSFFVIHSDRAAGIIEAGYEGDPELYVDCGSITFALSNEKGGTLRQFPASKARMSYEVIYGRSPYFLERHMQLRAAVQLIFAAAGKRSTQVSAIARYEITRRIYTKRPDGTMQPMAVDVIAFSSGNSAALPQAMDSPTVRCGSTGRLERDALAALGP